MTLTEPDLQEEVGRSGAGCAAVVGIHTPSRHVWKRLKA